MDYIAAQLREAERQLMQMGETMERTRDDATISLRGRRDQAKHTIRFFHDADIAVGDTVRSVIGGATATVVDVHKHVVADMVTYILVHYETAADQAKRIASEPAKRLTIAIGAIHGSIVNLSSDLADVAQSIGALETTGQIDAATLTELIAHLSEVIRVARELMDRLESDAQ